MGMIGNSMAAGCSASSSIMLMVHRHLAVLLCQLFCVGIYVEARYSAMTLTT